MSNEVITIDPKFGQLSTKFAGMVPVDDLSAGIQGGFGMIGYKGKVWSTRHRGVVTPLMREDGDGARGSIEVVILKASTQIAKIWYKEGYVEGSIAPPDCSSTNGLVPDAGSPSKQAASCAACPRNAWGSQVKADGTAGKGKACSDSKRLAVVPLMDIPNEMLGGPMLLRVPAASLSAIATYGAAVAKLGYPYFGVGTRISFDTTESFQKFVIAPIRPLTDAEAVQVLALRDDPRVDRILAESEVPAEAAPVTPAGIAFEQPAPVAAKPVPAPVAAVVAPKPVVAPAPASGGFGGAAPAPTPGTPGVATSAPAAAAVQPTDELAALRAKLAALEAGASAAVVATTPKKRVSAAAKAAIVAAAVPADAIAETPAAVTTGFGGPAAPPIEAPTVELAADGTDFNAGLDEKLAALMGGAQEAA